MADTPLRQPRRRVLTGMRCEFPDLARTLGDVASAFTPTSIYRFAVPRSLASAVPADPCYAANCLPGSGTLIGERVHQAMQATLA